MIIIGSKIYLAPWKHFKIIPKYYQQNNTCVQNAHKSLSLIHGSYIIIMVFVVTNRSACICVLFERQNSKSEIDVLKISEQWWRLNISFILTAAFSTSNKMAIIGTVPFRLTAKNNFIKGPWYARAYDNYKYSVKG